MTKTTDDFIYSLSYSAKFITVARAKFSCVIKTLKIFKVKKAAKLKMLLRTCFLVGCFIISATNGLPAPQTKTSESPGD